MLLLLMLYSIGIDATCSKHKYDRQVLHAGKLDIYSYIFTCNIVIAICIYVAIYSLYACIAIYIYVAS